MNPVTSDRPRAVPRSRIGYEPYIVLLTWLNDSRSIRTGPGSRSQVERAFQDWCEHYRSDIENYLRLQDGEPRITGGTRSLAPEILRPFCLETIGSTDWLAILISDDFDPVLRISSEVELPVDHLTLGFSPSPASDSLGLSSFCFRDRSPFVGFRDFMKTAFLSRDERTAASSSSPRGSNPLFVVTRLKVGGIGALDRGALLQRAVFRAAAKKIVESCEKIGRHLGSPTIEELEIRDHDLDTFQCSFLDAQGAESVVLVTACANLSLAYSFVASLRGLTYRELWESESGLQLYLEDVLQDGSTRAVLDRLDREAGRPPSHASFLDRLGSNHVFAASVSTIGVSSDVFRNPRTSNLSGRVEAHARVSFCPGHEFDGEERLLRVGRTPKRLSTSPHRFLVGALDYIQPLAMEKPSAGSAASPAFVGIRATELLEELSRMLEEFRRIGEEHGESGLLRSSTVVVVPVPRLPGLDALVRRVESPQTPEHVPILRMLHWLSDHPFRTRVDDSRNKTANESASRDRWEVVLRRGTRKAQLPVILCRNIEFVFKKYVRCLEHPLLFDNVLDLHDAMQALYFALAPPESGPTIRVDERSVDDLVRVVQALQNALSHRISTRPNADEPDWTVDYRGALNRLVLALDAPMKSGIGLLKWCIRNLNAGTARDRSAPQTPLARTFEHVCAVTRVGIQPRPQCRRLLRGSSSFFARVDMNVAVVSHPSQLIWYLHEAAHFIYEAREDLQEELRCAEFARGHRMPGFSASAGQQRATEERRQELFAELLTQFFVFGADWRLYRVYTIAKFYYELISLAETEVGRAQRLFETLFRAFLVSAPVRDVVWDPAGVEREYDPFESDPVIWPLEHPWHRGTCEPEEMWVRFDRFCAKYAPLIPEYGRLMRNREEWRERFELLFPWVIEDARVLWGEALGIFQAFANETPWRGPGRRREIHDLFEGSTWVETDGTQHGDNRIEEIYASLLGEVEPEKERVLELVLISQILYNYASFCFDEIREELDAAAREKRDPKILHSERDENGPVFNPKPRVDLLLDRRYGGQFCIDPAKRQARMLKKILVWKTLDDIGARQRGRRLRQILRGE